MNRFKCFQPLALIAVVALGVGGCGGGDTQSGDAKSAPPALSSVASDPGVVLPVGEEEEAVKDQSRWTLPFDPYWAPRTMNLESQASSLLISGCMAKAGFPQYKPWWDMNAPKRENASGNGRGTFFNEDLAAKYGYHMAPDPRYLSAAAIKAAGGGLWENASDEFQEQLGNCIEDSDKQMGVGPGSSDEEDPTSGIRSQMNQLTFDEMPEAVTQAVSKWRECMAPLGIADLPDSPWAAGGRLPESLMAKWDWKPIDDPSAEEIEMAVTDAKCRRDSGWFDAYYDAWWELEEDFVAKHKTDLAPILEKNKEDAKHFEQIIKEHSDTTK